MVSRVIGISVSVLLVLLTIFWEVVDMTLDRDGPFYE